MLTSDVYLHVVQLVQERKIQATREKERSKTEKAKSKRRRLLQWEARALEVVEARVENALQRQEAALAKAFNHAEIERKKAKRAVIRAQHQLMCANRAPRRSSQQDSALIPAEMVVGRQADGRQGCHNGSF
jgi:hypothetical protein